MNIQIPGIQAALTEETDRRHPERTEGILKDFGKFLEEARRVLREEGER